MVAHIAQALHHDAFTVQLTAQTGLFHPLGVAEESVQRILHTAACRFGAAMDAARVDRLARHTGNPVDVRGVHALVLIRDPGHLALARAHVGGGNVLRGVDHIALDQLVCETAGDQFQLVFVIVARINAQPAFGAPERRFDQRAFIGHQRRQRLYLVLVHAGAVPDAALDRLHVFGMDRAIAGKGLDTAAQAHAETHRVGRVAHANLLFQTRRQVHQGHRPVKHDVDAIAKARFGSGVHSTLLNWLCDPDAGRFIASPFEHGTCVKQSCKSPYFEVFAQILISLKTYRPKRVVTAQKTSPARSFLTGDSPAAPAGSAPKTV